MRVTVEKVYDEYYELNPVEEGSVCDRCGAVVGLPETHDAFHEMLNSLARQAQAAWDRESP